MTFNRRMVGAGLMRRSGARGGGAIFSPAALSGLRLWLDANVASSISTDTGVDGWADLSGQGNDGAQATGTDQPAYTTSNADFSGKATVDFDGTNDYLQFTGASLAAVQNGTDLPFTLAMAAKQTPASGDVLFAWSRDNANTYTRAFATASSVIRCGRQDDVPATAQTSAETLTMATAQVLIVVCDGTTISTYFDGVVDVNGQAFNVDAQTITRFALASLWDNAAGQFCEIDIGGVLVYNRALSAGEITQINSYMTARHL